MMTTNDRKAVASLRHRCDAILNAIVALEGAAAAASVAAGMMGENKEARSYFEAMARRLRDDATDLDRAVCAMT